MTLKVQFKLRSVILTRISIPSTTKRHFDVIEGDNKTPNIKRLLEGREPRSIGYRRRPMFFKKWWAISGLFFFIFVFTIQLTVCRYCKVCRWLDSNRHLAYFKNLPRQKKSLCEPPSANDARQTASSAMWKRLWARRRWRRRKDFLTFVMTRRN